MNHAEIIATNMTVPQRSESASEIADQIGRSVEWVEQNVGVSNRFISSPGDDPADLAAQAATPLIEQFGTPDLLLYASASVRQFLPDTSVFVARKLGLDGIPCYSMHATCLSFLVAMQHATFLVQSGQCQKVLIVCCELATQSRNFEHPESAALFGDGATAVLLGATDRPAGMIHFDQQTWPEFAELSQIQGGGLLRNPRFMPVDPSEYLFEMDGEALLRATMPRLRKFLKRFFDNESCALISIEDIDWLIPHQASAAGMKLLERLGFPKEKTVNILEDFGNCVSASLPMALHHARPKLRTDDYVLFLGSAAGLSIGATLWKC